MEYRITIDDEMELLVHSLPELMGIVEEYGDEVVFFCYDELDYFAEWLESVDGNKAKILIECRKQIGQHGAPFLSFMLKAPMEWSSVRIVKEWGKVNSPIIDEPSEESPREWVVTEEDVKSVFDLELKDLRVGKSNIDVQKRRNAIVSMRIFEGAAQVVAQYDSTLWGGAREGFVITGKGVYAKQWLENPMHWQWDEIEYACKVGDKIEINGYEFFVFERQDELAVRICELISKARINAGVDERSFEFMQNARLFPWYKRYGELFEDPALKDYASDIPAAVALLKQKAGDENDPIAQYALAYMLLVNRSICVDEVESACDWLKKAAMQGMVMAIRMLYSFREHPEYLLDSDVVKQLHASFRPTLT